MTTINDGFDGWEYIYVCDFAPIESYDPYPIIFPGDGVYNPLAYPCYTSGGATTTTYPVPGMDDGEPHPVWTSDQGVAGFLTDVFAPFNPIRFTVTGKFGLMNDDQSVNYLNYGNGPMRTGLCCCLNGPGRNNDGTRGFGLSIANGDVALGGMAIALVAFQNGLEQYTILHGNGGLWGEGTFVHLTLSWALDPTFLKGVYLKASVNGVTFAELVYTDVGSYRPSSGGACGQYATAGTGRVIIFHEAG